MIPSRSRTKLDLNVETLKIVFFESVLEHVIFQRFKLHPEVDTHILIYSWARKVAREVTAQRKFTIKRVDEFVKVLSRNAVQVRQTVQTGEEYMKRNHMTVMIRETQLFCHRSRSFLFSSRFVSCFCDAMMAVTVRENWLVTSFDLWSFLSVAIFKDLIPLGYFLLIVGVVDLPYLLATMVLLFSLDTRSLQTTCLYPRGASFWSLSNISRLISHPVVALYWLSKRLASFLPSLRWLCTTDIATLHINFVSVQVSSSILHCTAAQSTWRITNPAGKTW